MVQERQADLFTDEQPPAKEGPGEGEELLGAPPLEQGILVSDDTPWYERPLRGSRPEVVAWPRERMRLMHLREAIWEGLVAAEVYTIN